MASNTKADTPASSARKSRAQTGQTTTPKAVSNRDLIILDYF
jgi:hypothetical protein